MANITLDIIGDVANVSGELTRETVPSIHSNLLKKILSQPQVTIDVAMITKVDTAGLAWIMLLIERAEKYNVSAKFQHIPQELNQLATLSGVAQFIPLKENT